MNKKLLKLYIILIITFLISINIFPSIFGNINNGIYYIKAKTELVLKKNKNYEVNIYANKANVIIMFDDGWKTQYTIGYKYMHQKDMRGSIAIITSLIGEKYYMNNGELYILYNDNWDFLNHTYSHAILNKSNVKKQIDEINKAHEWLQNKDFISPNNILIYPEGEYNSDTIAVMKKLNYISGRGTEEGYNQKIPDDFYDIKVKNVLSFIEPIEVNEWIDYTIDNNLTLILLFHKLENNVDETLMKYKIDDFYKVIDYIDKRRDDLNIITYSDWIQSIMCNTEFPNLKYKTDYH